MDDRRVNQKMGILDLTRISKTQFDVVVDKYSKEYKDMPKREFKKTIEKMASKKRLTVVAYIGWAMHEHVKAGKDAIRAPYHFG